MNFELGKKYIVKVTEKGIIPIDEFPDFQKKGILTKNMTI